MLFLFKFFFLCFLLLWSALWLFLFLSQHTFTQNRKRCQTSLAKSLPFFPSLGVFGTPVLWLSSDLLFCLFVLFSFFSSVFPFSFFVKNQMHLTLKIMTQ